MTDHRKPKIPCTIEANRSCKGPPDGGEENIVSAEGAEVEVSLDSEWFLWSGWHLLPHYFLYEDDGSYVIADWYRCPLVRVATTGETQICEPSERIRWIGQTYLFDIGKYAGNDAKTLVFLIFLARKYELVAQILYRWRLSGKLPRHLSDWGQNWRRQ